MKYALLFLVVVSCSASAQVYKCPDPVSKRTVYSDQPCASGGELLQNKRSQAEIEYERQRAATEYRRFQVQQERETAIQEQRAQNRSYQPQQVTGQQPNSIECARAQQALSVMSSSVTGSQVAREREIAAANRRADLACFGGATAGAIRQSEAGATKVEITNHNYGNDRQKSCWKSKNGNDDCW